MSVRVKRLTIRGFKSIRDLRDFEPKPINILVGANGAGKSNFISFFRLMSWMMGSPPNLQRYVAEYGGGANALLYDGADVTRSIQAEITLETEQGENDFMFWLSYAAGDTFIFVNEKYRFSRYGWPQRIWNELGAGHRESKLVSEARTEEETRTARTILALLRLCVVYQFHNTSLTSRMRQKWDADENRYLKEDGGNLAPFLLRLRENKPRHYGRIVDTIRLVAPFFSDFELEPEHGKVMLKWREEGTDIVFSAFQASDGMLRTMAMVALLGQPEDDLPGVLILDEPELGLHPYAINVVAGMLRSVSQHVQVFIATQSATFVNQFEPEEVVIVDRAKRESTFRRLNGDELKEWLEEYTLAELWQKNVLGGRPGSLAGPPQNHNMGG